MSAVTYPSREFPALAGVEIDVPDGWEPRTLPTAQIVMVEPAGDGPFRTNVVVVVTRFVGATTLDDLAGQAQARMSEAPGFREIARESGQRHGAGSFRFSGTWTDPQVGQVSQTVTLYEVAHDGVRDLVEVTTSSAGAPGSDSWRTAQSVQDSVRVHPHAAH